MAAALSFAAPAARAGGDPLAVVSPRLPRCRIALRHYRRSAPYTPSVAAVAGALDIYAEGRRNDDVPRMLFGLSILGRATKQQVEAALAVRSASGPRSAAESGAWFCTPLDPIETIPL
jgi:hypothetical protein